MAKIAPIISTYKDFQTLKKDEKLLIYSPLLPLNSLAQATFLSSSQVVPAVFTLSQPIFGNHQRTCIVVVPLSPTQL